MIVAIVSMVSINSICLLIFAWNFHRYVKLDVKRDELAREELDGISQHLGFVEERSKKLEDDFAAKITATVKELEEEKKSLCKELRKIIKRDSLDRVNTFQDISRKFNRIEERLQKLEGKDE